MRRVAGLDGLLGRGARVEVSPAVVVSRAWSTFEFRVTLGAGGLALNDSLGMVCGSNIDRWQFQFASNIWGRYTPWQTDDPAAPNFLTVTCSRAGVTPEVCIGASGGLKPFHNEADHFVHSLAERFRYVLEVASSKRLRKGDTICITWGDTTYGSLGVQAPSLAFAYYFLPFKFSLLPRYDRELPIRQGNFEVLPCVRVTGKTATRLHCAVKPLAAKGERLRIHCAAVDEYGNLDENFRGTVEVRSSDKTAEIPAKISFTSRHKGRRKVDDVRLNRKGWQNITLDDGKIKSAPHPVLVSEAKPKEQIYFGEMHGHTLDDDGTFRSEEHYAYAREVAGLDFCSLAVHAEYFGTVEAWKKYLKLATKAHAPNEFVVFYGYEWAGEGHTNAYFLKEKDAVNIYGKRILRGEHPRDNPEFRIPCNTEQGFLELVESLECQAFCISHCHSAYVPPVNDSVLWLHEVYSMHQQNSLDKKLREILSQGLRIGVVAGSDSHRLPMGSLCPDPDKVWRQPMVIAGHRGSDSIQRRCGIQATFASALSRQHLCDSMKQRFTYGTTGARMVLLFEINGAHMGEEILVDSDMALELYARIGGTAKLAEVCVLKYDGKKWSTPINKTDIGRMTYDLKYKSQPLKADSVYYLRVTQEDGERAWSSPIWVRKRMKDEGGRNGNGRRRTTKAQRARRTAGK